MKINNLTSKTAMRIVIIGQANKRLYFSQHKFVHFNGTQMTQKDADWRRFLFFFCVSLRVLRQSAFYNSMNGNTQFHTAQSINAQINAARSIITGFYSISYISCRIASILHLYR